ncbi:MAG: hypothetical protein OEW49_00430 [Nitrosopumilus sp.]|nr:hypothetical protein [Nitrosopumilus sp.]
MIGQLVLDYSTDTSKRYRSFRNFIRGISRESTKVTYVKFLRAFMKFHKIEDYDEMTSFSAQKIDEMLEDYIDELEGRGVKGITIRTNLAGIERFFEMNDCIWHKSRIRKSIKRDDGIPGGSEPITTKEIKRMLECTKSLRIKALVHFLASTGMRPAGLVDPVLKIKHLMPMPRPNDTTNQKWCYAVRVYDESKEGYWSFLTPEATEALDNFFAWRENRGEKITQESPIFINIENNKHTRFQHITDKNTRFIIDNLIRQSALKRKKVSDRRFDKSIIYMFRKRFNTTLKLNNEVNSNIAEKLMAHKKGLDGTYLQPTQEECYKEFIKAIPELTIDDSERKQIELDKFKQEKIESQDQSQKIEELNSKIEMLTHKMDLFSKTTESKLRD